MGLSLGENGFKPKYKEGDVANAAELISESLDFGIETLGRGVGQAVLKVVEGLPNMFGQFSFVLMQLFSLGGQVRSCRTGVLCQGRFMQAELPPPAFR